MRDTAGHVLTDTGPHQVGLAAQTMLRGRGREEGGREEGEGEREGVKAGEREGGKEGERQRG